MTRTECIDDRADHRDHDRGDHDRANDGARGGEPAGLLHLGRAELVRVVALYMALAIAVLAIPAWIAQPRGAPSHPSQQEVRPAPGRAR